MPRPGTDRLVSTFGHLELGTAGPSNQIRLNRMIRTMDNGRHTPSPPINSST